MLAPPASRSSLALRNARLLALLVPVALLGGALLSQYVGGLVPCEMCWWQRYPHIAAILLAALAFTAPTASGRTRAFVALAAIAIAVSGLIGVYHVGVEQHWWEGPTQCTGNGARTLDEILHTKVVMCDQVQWSLFGLSLAAFNAIFSIGGAIAIGALLAKGKRA
ncbi:disulfide bond formation protein B [Sphingomonas sp. ASV193]|uniref:disulfide bond formation protein B n=1 Tax=Sphingomonas sp. ASV193 TaxID=3144405 RepID=UPI0032E8C804